MANELAVNQSLLVRVQVPERYDRRFTMTFWSWFLHGTETGTDQVARANIRRGQPTTWSERSAMRSQDRAAQRKAEREAAREAKKGSGDFFGDGRDFWGRKK